VAITGQGAVASSLSTANSVHEKILAEAGWKLEKTFGGILDAALAQQRKAHGPIIPMLPGKGMCSQRTVIGPRICEYFRAILCTA
jgi:hypothetical protein